MAIQCFDGNTMFGYTMFGYHQKLRAVSLAIHKDPIKIYGTRIFLSNCFSKQKLYFYCTSRSRSHSIRVDLNLPILYSSLSSIQFRKHWWQNLQMLRAAQWDFAIRTLCVSCFGTSFTSLSSVFKGYEWSLTVYDHWLYSQPRTCLVKLFWPSTGWAW